MRLLGAVLLGLALPAPAAALDGDGFFVRLTLGPTYVRTQTQADRGPNLELRGPGLELGMAAGAAVADRLYLHGQVQLASLSGADVEYGGLQTEVDDLHVDVFGVGLGVTRYFPWETYLTGAVLATQLMTGRSGRDRTRTTLGPSLLLSLGKEFQANDAWNLGVALTASLATGMEGEGDVEGESTSWSRGFGLVFSVSYN